MNGMVKKRRKGRKQRKDRIETEQKTEGNYTNDTKFR